MLLSVPTLVLLFIALFIGVIIIIGIIVLIVAVQKKGNVMMNAPRDTDPGDPRDTPNTDDKAGM